MDDSTFQKLSQTFPALSPQSILATDDSEDDESLCPSKWHLPLEADKASRIQNTELGVVGGCHVPLSGCRKKLHSKERDK